MKDTLQEIKEEALQSLEDIESQDGLEEWQITYLGRSSDLMNVFKNVGDLPPDQRPVIGRMANEVKEALEEALDHKKEALHQAQVRDSLQGERIDVTLPGRPQNSGNIHPTTATMREMYRIFGDMGFQIYRSREIESDRYNFQMLNFPPHHPAREMQDTFFIRSEKKRGDNPLLLRTHTSPGQIHAMRDASRKNPDHPPPLRLIVPGMCYRYEQISARSEIQFNQIEGLAVGETITFGDLKGTLNDFARRMFGQQVGTRFRASHFPFTEPSAEMDIECFLCEGQGCSVCKGTGWLEILGCGMVHPNVLKNGGYDPQHYTGFAFGIGPERITMLRHRIEDIRYFWANDLRFLEQF